MGKLTVKSVNTPKIEMFWDPSKQEEVESARKFFEQYLSKGYIAIAKTRTGESKFISEFNPSFEEIEMWPLSYGG